MGEIGGKSVDWENGGLSGSTVDPGITVSEIAEEVPSLTVAAIIGVTVVVLVAIAMVFVLGVLIDWRQQRMLEKRMGEVKRMKNQRRVNTRPESDSVSIANNMEEPGYSAPPAAALRDIP